MNIRSVQEGKFWKIKNNSVLTVYTFPLWSLLLPSKMIEFRLPDAHATGSGRGETNPDEGRFQKEETQNSSIAFWNKNYYKTLQ